MLTPSYAFFYCAEWFAIASCQSNYLHFSEGDQGCLLFKFDRFTTNSPVQLQPCMINKVGSVRRPEKTLRHGWSEVLSKDCDTIKISNTDDRDTIVVIFAIEIQVERKHVNPVVIFFRQIERCLCRQTSMHEPKRDHVLGQLFIKLPVSFLESLCPA